MPRARATASIMFVCAREQAVLTELELEGMCTGEKLQFRERILEASKFTVGSSLSVPGNEDSH